MISGESGSGKSALMRNRFDLKGEGMMEQAGRVVLYYNCSSRDEISFTNDSCVAKYKDVIDKCFRHWDRQREP